MEGGLMKDRRGEVGKLNNADDYTTPSISDISIF